MVDLEALKKEKKDYIQKKYNPFFKKTSYMTNYKANHKHRNLIFKKKKNIIL